jgi:hypothetical protein
VIEFFQRPRVWLSAVAFVVLILTACLGVALIAVREIRAIAAGDVVVQATGAVLFKAPHRESALFLLSPAGSRQTPWVNTGISVKAGESFSIRQER